MSDNFSRFLLICVVFISWCISNNVERTNRYVIKVNKTFKDNIMQILNMSGFILLYEITPETYIIEYARTDSGVGVLRKLSSIHSYQIIAWEPVRVYNNTLQPTSDNLSIPPLNQSTIVCKDYYGMGVEDVWRLGYTGKGVTIAVNDVGVNVDLLDLTNKIENSLSFNFLTETMNVTPEEFTDMSSEAAQRTDHGNRVASVVAAEKDNHICNAGIAFNATLAALKIFKVDRQSRQQTTSAIVGRSFVHKLYDIDIFVNAWRPTGNFDTLDLSSIEALKFGASMGRRGLGTIYVVPAGRPGNLLTNNIYTITVGGIGRFGTVPSDATIDASVITSGLSMGNNITAQTMITASKNNKCISSFNGTSLATAQIAGIIALGIEANRNLSRRDILHLLVKASERTALKEANEFRKNGAGLYVHNNFGFGLLNARRFVKLAKQAMPTPKLITANLYYKNRYLKDTLSETTFCFDCSDINAEHCITNIEYVEVAVKLITNTGFLKISVISPSNTESLLIDEKLEQSGFTSTMECSFVSAHFWDEAPFGNWKIKIQQYLQNHTTFVDGAKITLHGTESVHSQKFKHISLCEENGDLEDHNKSTVEIFKTKQTTAEVPNYNYVILICFQIVIVSLLCFGYLFYKSRTKIPLTPVQSELEINLLMSQQSMK